MIIGAKKVDDLDPFSVGTIAEFESGMNDQLAQGMPLEIPVAMPFGQMCQMARTIKVYKAILDRLCELEIADIEHTDAATATLTALQEDAQALLDMPVPPPAPAVQPAQGRIILPK